MRDTSLYNKKDFEEKNSGATPICSRPQLCHLPKKASVRLPGNFKNNGQTISFLPIKIDSQVTYRRDPSVAAFATAVGKAQPQTEYKVIIAWAIIDKYILNQGKEWGNFTHFTNYCLFIFEDCGDNTDNGCGVKECVVSVETFQTPLKGGFNLIRNTVFSIRDDIPKDLVFEWPLFVRWG